MELKNAFVDHFKKLPGLKIWLSPAIVLGWMFICLFAGMHEVYAQGELTLTTSYPGITAKPGENVEFPLEIQNMTGTPQKANLKILSIPNGWKGTFTGGGKTVHQVLVNGRSSESVDLRLEVPAETSEGDYAIVIDGGSRLTLNLKIRKEENGGSKLVAQYPELQGSSGATFKFRVDLTNSSAESQSYSLGARVPRGWEVNFSPAYDHKQIASISVEGNQSQGLDVEMNPPDQVKAGEYKIPIVAVSPKETLTTELKVIIKGNYKMDLTTPTGRLSVESYAGKKKEVTLKVINSGSSDLKDVKFDSWEPQNWSVSFEPKQLDVLPAGESQEVKAYIQPDGKAIAGDYVVRLTARTPETSSSAEFRVMVKTSTLWGITGIAIIVILAAGLYWVFKEYGRR